jgi:hypothetical protein
MSAANDQLRAANWERMRTAITDAASEYRKLADELERIPFDNSRGRRAPEAVISEAALTAGNNIAARMLHRMAGWAESICEIDRYAAQTTQICGYTIDDPHTTCVLAPGHQLPTDSGMTVHVNEHGGTFL